MILKYLKEVVSFLSDDLEVYRVNTVEEAESIVIDRKNKGLKDICLLVVPLYDPLEFEDLS